MIQDTKLYKIIHTITNYYSYFVMFQNMRKTLVKNSKHDNFTFLNIVIQLMFHFCFYISKFYGHSNNLKQKSVNTRILILTKSICILVRV